MRSSINRRLLLLFLLLLLDCHPYFISACWIKRLMCFIWILTVSCGSRVSEQIIQALLPDRHVQGFWWKIWSGSWSCWPGTYAVIRCFGVWFEDTDISLIFLQSAVGFEYAGKTEKHASQKGEHAFSLQASFIPQQFFAVIMSLPDINTDKDLMSTREHQRIHSLIMLDLLTVLFFCCCTPWAFCE